MLKSFDYIVDRNTRLLVIGSMPGEASLRAKEYYAHPQNLFWRFVFEAFSENYNNPDYSAKISVLLKHHVGLWDVAKNCIRQGSADATISKVKCNNFHELLNSYPGILKFLFNGKKAYELFQKFNPDLLKNRDYVILPSTSPANASIKMEIKRKMWISELKKL